MNLLSDPWIPVRCLSGQRRTISPLDLVDEGDPPVELDAIRADFGGALAQLLIGLLQWLAPDDITEWRRIAGGTALPDLQRLRELTACFEFDNGSRRFMQDMDFDSAETGELSGLLLDAPGDNTVKNNADLFIKRSPAMALSMSLAAQALLTLQINAPAGGQGHRTSVRGGGPVTFLLWPNELDGRSVPLWQKLWLNTLVLAGEPPRSQIVFPWMAPCMTSEDGRDVLTQLDAQEPNALELALLCYFATPRRIRLNFDDDGVCTLSGIEGRCASGFKTQNFGANYPSDRFRHPLSPYYREKKGNFLPAHVRDAGFTYADWLRVQGDADDFRIPQVLEASRIGVSLGRSLASDAIRAFGFAMDNMKCLAWNEARFPRLVLDDPARKAALLVETRRWIEATEHVRRALGKQLRAAWSNQGKGDTGIAERELYSLTEHTFHILVKECSAIEGSDAVQDDQHQMLRRRWQLELARAAMSLFTRHAERGDVAEQTMRAIERTAHAHRALWKAVYGETEKVLDLDIARHSAKKATGKRSKTQ